MKFLNTEHAEFWFLTDVWYCDQKGWESWVVTCKDLQGNCVGESEYFHYKSDALRCARGYLYSDRCLHMQVERKNGTHQYVESV